VSMLPDTGSRQRCFGRGGAAMAMFPGGGGVAIVMFTGRGGAAIVMLIGPR